MSYILYDGKGVLHLKEDFSGKPLHKIISADPFHKWFLQAWSDAGNMTLIKEFLKNENELEPKDIIWHIDWAIKNNELILKALKEGDYDN